MRYGLEDLQPADIDDIRQVLAEHYCEQIAEKHNYIKATNLQAYFSTILRRRMSKWAIKRTKEQKTVGIEYAMEIVIPARGKLDIYHECLKGLTLKERVMVILRYAADLTGEEIAEVVSMDREAVYKAIQRAVEKIKINSTSE